MNQNPETGRWTDPHDRRQGLSSRRGLFKGLQTDAVEMTVAPGPVVEHFDVIEDIRPGQIPGFIDTFSDPLFFQRTEERFGHGIILTVATPAYARCQVIGPAEALPVVAGVLAVLDAIPGASRYRDAVDLPVLIAQ